MSYIHFGTFRIGDAVDKAGTFTGEGICEVVGLMCRPNVKDSQLYLVAKGTSSCGSDVLGRLLHGELNVLCPQDSS